MCFRLVKLLDHLDSQGPDIVKRKGWQRKPPMLLHVSDPLKSCKNITVKFGAVSHISLLLGTKVSLFGDECII